MARETGWGATLSPLHREMEEFVFQRNSVSCTRDVGSFSQPSLSSWGEGWHAGTSGKLQRGELAGTLGHVLIKCEFSPVHIWILKPITKRTWSPQGLGCPGRTRSLMWFSPVMRTRHRMFFVLRAHIVTVENFTAGFFTASLLES